MSTQRWVDRAAGIAIAHADEGREHNLGAIVVKGGSILSIGANRQRNNPHSCPGSIPRRHWSFCAEQAALHRLKPGTARGATLYIARVSPKTGETRYAHPCPKCTELILEAGISKVVYTGNNDTIILERIRSFKYTKYAIE